MPEWCSGITVGKSFTEKLETSFFSQTLIDLHKFGEMPFGMTERVLCRLQLICAFDTGSYPNFLNCTDRATIKSVHLLSALTHTCNQQRPIGLIRRGRRRDLAN